MAQGTKFYRVKCVPVDKSSSSSSGTVQDNLASSLATSKPEDEVEKLRAKIEKLEAERNDLKSTCDKHESRISDLERRMTQQHEDDLEQLATVKKQLEKKLNDAYEEVEDQRQVVAQWKSQLETQVGRLKETIERLNKEVDDIRIREQSRQDQQKKMGRQLRDLKEDTLQGKESDLVQKNGDLEKQIEVSDVEVMTLKSDLKLAMKSIEDLQVAISGDIEDDA